MAEVAIRPGVVADAEALRELALVVIPATYTAIDPAEAERTVATWWSVDALTTSLQKLPHWVAEDASGSLVGMANLGPRDDLSVMWKLYVHPDQQGTGLGRRLLRHVIEANGDRDLWLSYVDGNANAAGFYEAHGFEEVRREPAPPYPDQVWMRRRP